MNLIKHPLELCLLHKSRLVVQGLTFSQRVWLSYVNRISSHPLRTRLFHELIVWDKLEMFLCTVFCAKTQ